jgi:hypothetical protein
MAAEFEAGGAVCPAHEQRGVLVALGVSRDRSDDVEIKVEAAFGGADGGAWFCGRDTEHRRVEVRSESCERDEEQERVVHAFAKW